MIIGELKDYKYFSGLGDNFLAGLKYLSEHSLRTLTNRKYVINGDKLYFEVSDLMTKHSEEKFFEVHKYYADIHITLKGSEFYGWARDQKLLKQYSAYHTERDTSYYLFGGTTNYFQVPADCFVIFMPGEAHKPGLGADKSEAVRKLVMKVKVNDD